MDVHEFVQGEIPKPFRWGDTDCATTSCRWIKNQTGFSPMAALGRVHKNEVDAKEWLKEPGGFVVAVNRVMRETGFTKTKDPIPGDVGLVIWGDTACAAICTRFGWFTRNENGFILVPTYWKAWKVECPD